MLSVLTAKSELEAITHGVSLAKFQNIYGIFNRSARQLLSDIDPMTTKRTSSLANVYNDVYNYASPTDLKGNKIIDIRPQVNRNLSDSFTQKFSKGFDLYKGNFNFPMFNIRNNSGVKTLRINASNEPSGTLISMASSLTGNGTWSASGNASNLQQDTINYVDGSGSLSFDLATSGSQGIVSNSTIPSLDLSEHENNSSIFFYVYLPTASNFTSIQIKWGTDASNYWTRTLTATHEGNAFSNGWNLLRADWNGATEVGTGTSSNIQYLSALYNYDGTAQTSARLNDIISTIGLPYYIDYYSKYLFQTSGGTWKETATDDSDVINLDTDEFNLYLNLLAINAIQQSKGADGASDIKMFSDLYQIGLQKYKLTYKSEVQATTSSYYKEDRWRNIR